MNAKPKKARQKNDHGQYFTPPSIAGLMLSLSMKDTSSAVLEPCSGKGVFLDLLCQAGFEDIDAVEIDSSLAQHSKVAVQNSSFVAFAPGRKYDLVIGNPPYIRWKDLSDVGKQEMQEHSLYGELFNSLSDYLTVFVASSVNLLAEQGELIFITPSFWMHTTHSQGLRDWLLERGSITDLIDFGEAKVFDKVSSAIVVFRFVLGAYPSRINHYVYTGVPRTVPTEGLSLFDTSLFSRREIPAFKVAQHWTLATEDKVAELDAFENRCSVPSDDLLEVSSIRRLGDFVKIANGMVLGLDRAFRVSAELASLLSPAERKATVRVLKAKDLEPFYSSRESLYIDIPAGLDEGEVRNRYPNFYEHLSGYRTELEERYSYGSNLPFWEWAFRRSELFFLSESRKGFVPCKERLTNRPTARFSLSNSGVVATQDVTAFAPLAGVRESIEYIVAYLNHPSVSKWIRFKGLMKGGVAEFSERPLSEIPFRQIDFENSGEVELHEEITTLVRSLERESIGDRKMVEERIRKGVDLLLAKPLLIDS